MTRKFEVNGEAVFIRGGNYIVSDALLRLSQDRYDTEVGFHADMNLNMIRIWGGALAERPEFYDACDRRGILVSTSPTFRIFSSFDHNVICTPLTLEYVGVES